MDLPRNSPTLSVVIPTIRIDDHLAEAVESVQRQTVEDLDIVVVVDGPADGPVPGEDDERLRVLRLPRRVGTPTALNVGISASRAPLIARLDADDVAEPGRFAAQLRTMRRRPALVGIGSAATLIDTDGTRIGSMDVPTGPGAVAALLRRNVFVHSSMTLRASAVRQVGGYDPRCHRMQDYDLWLRLALVGELDNLPEPLVRYRVHGGMNSRRTSAWDGAARAVRSSRRRLARRSGTPTSAQLARDLLWTGAQAARQLGMREPGYLRGSSVGTERTEAAR